MVQHEARFHIPVAHADQVLRAIMPELADEVSPRSVTRCWCEGPSTLVVLVTAGDTASLRAALNMILRLVNVADEVQGLVNAGQSPIGD